jgi:hypothetical protein
MRMSASLSPRTALSALRYLVSGGQMYEKVIIVDDSPPYDVVPKQIYCSDCLDQGTNRNGLFQSPLGVLFQGQSIAFGNLTVKSCPTNSKFEIDATGALPWAQVEAQRTARAKAAALPPPPPYVPPPAPKVEPQPPPPPRPEWMVEVDAEAARQVAEATAARAHAKGPTICGPPLDAIRDDLFIAAGQRQAEVEAQQQANADMFAKAAAITAARDAAQAHATRLLRNRGI